MAIEKQQAATNIQEKLAEQSQGYEVRNDQQHTSSHNFFVSILSANCSEKPLSLLN